MRASRSVGGKASVSRSKCPTSSRTIKVLAQRSQESVAAVGAWVEGGEYFQNHPSVVASYVDQSQRETRRVKAENLRRFQDEVRHRVSQVNTRSVPDNPVREEARRVRERLASYQVVSHRECVSDPLDDRWNHPPHRHSRVPRKDEEEDDDEEEVGQGEVVGDFDEFPIQRHFIKSRRISSEQLGGGTDGPAPRLESNSRVSRVLWPLSDPEELKKQRQAQFLTQRRLFMSREREQAKENREHRKHLQKTASFKAEKEHLRLQEERHLVREQQLAKARQKLQERELLVLERLKLEDEERSTELRRRQEKERDAARYVDALRAQLKERVGDEDLPPLCCCASTFWDSHPDTCANNCAFYNNPKAYAQALRSAMLTLDLH
ncbi:coiled-coil domain-containing protein 15 isoform X2 [Synchiropus splendidus]|uniref:coiled-coil domain-containing protein 15 isoform X2 n=1 Tax=Synchiropus splendidus TaxID=270530 RepID=UPI00237DF21D|nr:coiled-coil domain-containing protein 15 isoform X2 [Synchiropus splendidus]